MGNNSIEDDTIIVNNTIKKLNKSLSESSIHSHKHTNSNQH